jgi:hypothetical protein
VPPRPKAGHSAGAPDSAAAARERPRQYSRGASPRRDLATPGGARANSQDRRSTPQRQRPGDEDAGARRSTPQRQRSSDHNAAGVPSARLNPRSENNR